MGVSQPALVTILCIACIGAFGALLLFEDVHVFVLKQLPEALSPPPKSSCNVPPQSDYERADLSILTQRSDAPQVALGMAQPYLRLIRDGGAKFTHANLTGVPNSAVLNAVDANVPLFVLAPSVDYWEGYVTQEFHHLFRTLRGAYEWGHFEGAALPPSWNDFHAALIRQFGRLPDVLLLCPGYEDNKWASIAALGARPGSGGIPRVWLWVDDVHVHAHTGKANRDNHLAAMLMSDVIVSPYTYRLKYVWPELGTKPRLWLPHAATSLFFLPPNAAPEPRILLAGAVDEWYPMRQAVFNRIAAKDPRFTQAKHPGYSYAYSQSTAQAFSGQLHAHLATFTCGSKIHYVLAKCFEIPATGSLLLLNTDIGPQMARLGFVAGKHYIAYNLSTIDSVADWVLHPSNRAKVDAIRTAGQALVWSRHMVSHRAASLHEYALAATAQSGGGRRRMQRQQRLLQQVPLRSPAADDAVRRLGVEDSDADEELPVTLVGDSEAAQSNMVKQWQPRSRVVDRDGPVRHFV